MSDEVKLTQEDRDLLITLNAELKHVQEDLGNFVTKSEFEPVRRIVYGATMLILLSVVGAVGSLVINGVHANAGNQVVSAEK